MPTSTPDLNLLRWLASDIQRGGGSQIKSGAADLLRRPLADEFLRGAIVPANAYKFVKFELPSAISFGDMEGVPK